MTGEALLIGNLGPQRMTFCAVRHPFEVGVRTGQVAGRDLGMDRACKEKQAYHEKDKIFHALFIIYASKSPHQTFW